jgi:hypothetical protein
MLPRFPPKTNLGIKPWRKFEQAEASPDSTECAKKAKEEKTVEDWEDWRHRVNTLC